MADDPHCIRILLVDLRHGETVLRKSKIDWQEGITARLALERALGQKVADQVARDLREDNRDLIVSYTNLMTDDHSEIGGMASLDWEVPLSSVLVVSYDDEHTSEEQISASSNWMMQNQRF